jgi:hypothetical protein
MNRLVPSVSLAGSNVHRAFTPTGRFLSALTITIAHASPKTDCRLEDGGTHA